MPEPDAILATKLIIAAAILVGSAIVAWGVSKLLNKQARQLVNHSKTGLDDTLLAALKGPLSYLVLLVGLWLALQEVDFIVNPNSPVLRTTFFILYLGVGYLAASRLISGLIDWYGHEIARHTETTLDDQILPFFRRIAVVILFFVALIILLSHFDVNVSALVTTLGIGSLAIALAAQEFLSNMISGFVIMVDRPFRIGDRIELEELGTWGDVQDITLHSTRILTRDHRMVSVPNALIAKNRVVNHSIPDTMFRVETHVGVAYGVDIEFARKVLVEAVRSQDWVMRDKPVEALFLEFQDSGLLFRVRCWIEHYVETRRIIDKLNSVIYRALTEAGIEIPFPQRVVHLHTSTPAARSIPGPAGDAAP